MNSDTPTLPACSYMRSISGRRYSDTSSSFTLVELMVVMVVIIILVGITLPVAKYVAKRSKETKEAIAKEKIVDALESYRAVFGEYPVPGDPRHYSPNYTTDTNSLPYSPITSIDLCTTSPITYDFGWGTTLIVTNPAFGVEHLPYDQNYYVSYRLTYPLMLGPLERGEPPFVEFPEITVCYLVYKREAGDVVDRYKTIRLKSTGKLVSVFDYTGLLGNPINRVKAVSPSNQQWWYESDGVTYTLSPTNEWGM